LSFERIETFNESRKRGTLSESRSLTKLDLVFLIGCAGEILAVWCANSGTPKNPPKDGLLALLARHSERPNTSENVR